jgi:WD40 repeat protein
MLSIQYRKQYLTLIMGTQVSGMLTTQSVNNVTFFNDNRHVVTASRDRTLRICDVQKRTWVGGSFEGHKEWVLSVAISTDNNQISSGGADKVVII